MVEPERLPQPGTFGLAAAIFAEREGRILILRRAGGEMSGAWYLPGGAVDEGETPEEAVRRELREEAGLEAGELTLIGVVPMHVYGRDALQVVYAASCPDGEPRLSHEHSASRWIDAREYRDRFFGDEQLARLAEGDPRRERLVRGVRHNLDEYIAWLDRRDSAPWQRPLAVEVVVVRDGRILALKRASASGPSGGHLPSGFVGPDEEPEVAAVRSVREATGIHIEAPQLLQARRSGRNDRAAYRLTYVAEMPDREVTPEAERTGWRWVELQARADGGSAETAPRPSDASATPSQAPRTAELVRDWIAARASRA